ncbi:hypothetical protein B0J11DRAFT_615840 [Dendryphion nanum]|uniref:Uncharacterized protein n=1 Tax=Dendryphion nanum TaxID=256645 RepID=A0A9P9DNY5_9PLEO|nr:hypothetical protein B0J11DRAFT_615840 [Dendryphion nanum]
MDSDHEGNVQSGHGEEGNDQPTYNRNEIITSLTDYYKFLGLLYLPSDSIKYPPEGGWQWPASTTFSPEKSEEVIELMRNLPYLQRPSAWDSINIYEKCQPEDYSQFFGEPPYNIDPTPWKTTLPAHVLMIGQPEGRDGHHIFLDTQRGTWTLSDFTVGPSEPTDLSVAVDDIENPVTRTDEDGRECTENWKEYATYTTPQFFTKLRNEFTELIAVPYPEGQVHFAHEEVGYFKDLFGRYGWPGEEYQKDECLEAVRRYVDGEDDEED